VLDYPETVIEFRERFTVDLAAPEEERRWNRLVRKRHYLKEDRLVGESLRYIARQTGKWIGRVYLSLQPPNL